MEGEGIEGRRQSNVSACSRAKERDITCMVGRSRGLCRRGEGRRGQ